MNNLQLLTNAQKILLESAENNDLKTAWEISFLAIGLAKVDWEKATNLIDSLLEKQQANGCLKMEINTQAVVPPILGTIVWKLYQQAENSEKALEFLREIFPKIVHFHQYLYQFHDSSEEGLCFIQHSSEYILKGGIHPENETLFRVQDPLFNTLLIWSNEALIRVAEVLKEDVTELVQWYELGVHTFNEKLWDAEYGIYNAWDLEANKMIPLESIAGLLPLVGGIPDIGQALQMLDLIQGNAFTGTVENPAFLCPTYSLESEKAIANKKDYGAISLDFNWLLYQGFQQYETPEFLEMADQVKSESLRLLTKNGFYEYFDARKKSIKTAGLGDNNSVISAAVLLDWLL